jgi:acyl transferase domain-containing protein
LFFGISPVEAVEMDPQQRLFLEEAWKTIEDAGYSARQLRARRVGVFAGVQPNDYGGAPGSLGMTGTSMAILAARIAYHLDLKGPALALDTACSSALVAIYLAWQSVRNGESDMALAGGVSCNLFSPRGHRWFEDSGMASAGGRCRAFDEGADGFTIGDGVGVLMLKRLDQARRDGDHIYGVIVGGGINQDGKTNGITAPSAPSQAALETEVYERFGINPETLQVVEAHGTGTQLGDPIEVQALTESFRQFTARRQFCALGSVKTNVGHLLAAAGVAGTIKLLLALQREKIPPSLHFQKANGLLALEQTPFFVNSRLLDWSVANGTKRRAAISSFGFSGTNAHLVIEEAPRAAEAADTHAGAWHLAAVSARTTEALRQRLADLENWLGAMPADVRFEDLCYGLNAGRTHFEQRMVFMARNATELRAAVHAPGGAVPAEVPMVLRDLASRYLAGEDVDWDAAYAGSAYRRVSLPVYPFARERYWRGRNREEIATHRFTGSEWMFRDHVAGGRPVMAGMALLEMARLDCGARALADVVWKRNLPADSNGLSLKTEIWREGDQRRFAVLAGDDRLCEGRISAVGPPEPAESRLRAELPAPQSPNRPTMALDLGAIRGRCSKRQEKAEFYRGLRGLGFDYGPAFQTVEEVWSDRTAVLAKLRMPPAIAQDPLRGAALLDGALQSLAAIQQELDAGLPVPFALDAVEWFGPIPEACWAYGETAGAAPGSRRFSIGLLDESGMPLLAMRDYTVAFAADERHECTFWETVWEDAPLPAAAAAKAGCTVLLGPAGGLGAAEDAWMAEHSLANPVVVVCAGEG